MGLSVHSIGFAHLWMQFGAAAGHLGVPGGHPLAEQGGRGLLRAEVLLLHHSMAEGLLNRHLVPTVGLQTALAKQKHVAKSAAPMGCCHGAAGVRLRSFATHAELV